MFHPQNSVAVASIHLPLAGTPISSSALQSVDNSTCKLQFIVFRNGKLFPCTGNSSNLADDGKRRSVSTPVAFTKLGKRKSIFIIMPMMSTLYCIVDSDYMLTLSVSVCSAQHVDTQAAQPVCQHSVLFAKINPKQYHRLTVTVHFDSNNESTWMLTSHCTLKLHSVLKGYFR